MTEGGAYGPQQRKERLELEDHEKEVTQDSVICNPWDGSVRSLCTPEWDGEDFMELEINEVGA